MTGGFGAGILVAASERCQSRGRAGVKHSQRGRLTLPPSRRWRIPERYPALEASGRDGMLGLVKPGGSSRSPFPSIEVDAAL